MKMYYTVLITIKLIQRITIFMKYIFHFCEVVSGFILFLYIKNEVSIGVLSFIFY